MFCDLDGTLINTKTGNTFPKGVWDMEFRFEVLDAIKKLKPKYVFIVSNQGGIEKGFVNEERFRNKLYYIRNCIKEYCNIKHNVDSVFCSSNNPFNSYRKPNTGMLEIFYHDYINGNDFNKKDALMIGDASGKEGQFSDTDKKTAENFGINYLDVDDFVKEYNQKESWIKRIFNFFKK